VIVSAPTCALKTHGVCLQLFFVDMGGGLSFIIYMRVPCAPRYSLLR
jgi:hypothetical protein